MYLGHRAPHLSALHIGDVTRPGQVKPVGLIQLGANQEVEIGNALVLSYQSGSQAQLAVGLHNTNHLPPYSGFKQSSQDCLPLLNNGAVQHGLCSSALIR